MEKYVRAKRYGEAWRMFICPRAALWTPLLHQQVESFSRSLLQVHILMQCVIRSVFFSAVREMGKSPNKIKNELFRRLRRQQHDALWCNRKSLKPNSWRRRRVEIQTGLKMFPWNDKSPRGTDGVTSKALFVRGFTQTLLKYEYRCLSKNRLVEIEELIKFFTQVEVIKYRCSLQYKSKKCSSEGHSCWPFLCKANWTSCHINTNIGLDPNIWLMGYLFDGWVFVFQVLDSDFFLIFASNRLFL